MSLVVLVFGALLFTFVVMTRASKGYDKAKQRRAAAGPSPACSTCRSSMTFVGLLDLQVSDESAVAESLGASEGRLPLEAYRCPTCRKLETFLPPYVP
ncbi:MAG TPA: hypothetical protein VNA87_03880 [Actinomycetota bacterium]|nr:hypothetical protein [Actinomycetota bacterium]